MMRVRELGIENFRKFRQPIRLTGFEDGLNLVCDQNEAGKSTVLEALRAALFERHGSRSDRIRSFRPHGDEVAPTVDLAFEIDGENWHVRKRFLQNPSVSLEGPSGRSTGDEAEEKLQALLGFNRAGNRGADEDSRGALGLLWIEQGQSFILGAPGQTARRTLEEVLAGEVGVVTGGQRTNAILQTVDKDLAEFLTATGRPTRKLLEAQEARSAAEATARQAREELEQFEAVLDRLEAKRNEHRRLVLDLENPDQDARLAQLNDDIDRAKAAGQTLRTAEAVLREVVGERERFEQRDARRSDLRIRLSQAEQHDETARAAASEHADALEAARLAERQAATALETARTALRVAEEVRLAAQNARTALERQRALGSAFTRLDAAEAISTELQTLRREIATAKMTEAAADRLQTYEQAVVEARAAATAGAAVLHVTLLPDAPDVRLNGTPIADSLRTTVIELQTLDLAGVGNITIEPPASGEAAHAKLRASEQDLADFLASVGMSTAAAARDAARSRARAEQAAQRLAVQLAAACPADRALGIGAGLDTLRGALAEETRPPAPTEAPDSAKPSDPETIWQAARTAERDADGRRQAALETLREAQLTEVRLSGQIERTAADVTRLGDDLAADLASQSDEDLAAAGVQAKTVESRAILARDEARRAVEGLDETALVQRRENLFRQRDRLREDRLALVGELAKLEERAKTLGGAGPATRAAAATEAADVAIATHERLKEDAEVLALLTRTVREAQRDAARRFLAPVTQRVAPYVTRLLPNATISFGEDLRPQLLVRGGREEATEDLSKGTQEQLAVLTRIAFADLLLEKGKPASLVLDDALVFADDDRFEIMLEILSEAARRMQVIVLSCRTSAYRRLDAKRIMIA